MWAPCLPVTEQSTANWRPKNRQILAIRKRIYSVRRCGSMHHQQNSQIWLINLNQMFIVFSVCKTEREREKEMGMGMWIYGVYAHHRKCSSPYWASRTRHMLPELWDFAPHKHIFHRFDREWNAFKYHPSPVRCTLWFLQSKFGD